MNKVLASAAIRHARLHPWLVLLGVLGVALGIAVVTAIDLTRASAGDAFEQATEVVTGRVTHHVTGGPLGVDEDHYAALRRAGISEAVAPIIDTTVGIGDDASTSIRMLGVDPIAEAQVRVYWGASGDSDFPFTALITRPETAVLSTRAAERLGVGAGDRLTISVGSRRVPLAVLAVLGASPETPALAGTDLLVVDISTAQELLDMAGRLSRIDLLLDGPEAIAAVEAWLPSGLNLVSAATKNASAASLTGAFYTNLQALSLMALLVGIFLIYNSQSFLVVRRRQHFGILRAMGVTRGELIVLILGEALVLGVLGTIAGLMMGYLLANELVSMVTRTINDLYSPMAEGRLAPDGLLIAKALMLGLGGSLVAGLVPAYEAGRVEPRAALSRSHQEAGARAGSRQAMLAGAAMVAVGVIVLAVPLRSVTVGFVGLFLVIIGFALMTPQIVRLLALRLGRLRMVGSNIGARLAVQGVAVSLSRTGVATAALMVAVATTVGIGIMVGSFRVSVENWLEQFLRADYYLSAPASAGSETGVGLSRELVAAVSALPGVEAVSHVRHVELTTGEGVSRIAAFQLNPRAEQGFVFLQRLDREGFWNTFRGGDGVFVSEPYAWHRGLTVGDELVLPAAAGPKAFPVLGVYRDYGSDRGWVAMSRRAYDRYWPGDNAVNGIGVYAGPGFSEASFRAGLAEYSGPDRFVALVANREIRNASLAIFDRTFAITEVLRLLAGIIAFIGVFSALLAIQLDRTRELGVLKALGMLPAQLRTIVLGETALIGIAAGAIAAPVGWVLAYVLIEVINRRSFGWGMMLETDPGIMGSGVLMALIAALLAGVYPASRMAQIQPADALRTE